MIVAKFFREDSKDINYLLTHNDGYIGLSFADNAIKEMDNNLFQEIVNMFYMSNESKNLFTYKNYDVYFDFKNKFKHFIKEGKEDYNLFFENNGQNAILYSGGMNKGVVKIIRNGIILVISVNLFLSGFKLIEKKEFYDIYKNYTDVEEIVVFVDEDITLKYDQALKTIVDESLINRAIELINASEINDEFKILFSNKALLENVLQYYDGNAINELFAFKLNHLNIVEGVKNNNSKDNNEHSTAASYNALVPNQILVESLDVDKEYLNDTLMHEFIHLLQNDNLKYLYLTETTAELMKNEYLNTYNHISSYNEGVETLKLLIDIIGPEPILKGVFGKDYSLLEGILAQNLSKDDFTELMGYFTKSPVEVLSNEKKIRNILLKLYKNIYGQSITEDSNIMYDMVYNSSGQSLEIDINKFYLNKSRFSEEFEIVVSKGGVLYLDILEELKKVGDIISVTTIYKDITVEEYNSLENKSSAELFEPGESYFHTPTIEDGMYIYKQYYDSPEERIPVEQALREGKISYYLVDKVEKDKIPDGWFGIPSLSEEYISKNPNLRIDSGKIVFKIKNMSERFEISKITNLSEGSKHL